MKDVGRGLERTLARRETPTLKGRRKEYGKECLDEKGLFPKE